MDLGKYKKAMRPKKYLDGRFVIYDPSLPDASDEQLGARDEFAIGGGVIEGNDLGTREGFSDSRLNETKLEEPYLFSYDTPTGGKRYQAKVMGSDLSKAMRRAFPYTEEGKKQALEAIADHLSKYKIGSKIRKMKEPPDPKKPWRYKTSDGTRYFATEAEAEAFKQSRLEGRTIKQTKLPTEDYDKIVKRIKKGETLDAIAKDYGLADASRIRLLLKNKGVTYSQLTPNISSYTQDPDLQKLFIDNYKKLSTKNLSKKLFPEDSAETARDKYNTLRDNLKRQNKIEVKSGYTEELKESFSKEPKDVQAKKIRENRDKKIKEVSDLDIEKKINEFKIGEGLDKAHRLSLDQVKKTNELYNILNLGIEAPDINREVIQSFEDKLAKLYNKQNKLVKDAKKYDKVPREISNQLSDLNRQISDIVSMTDGRLQGIHVDEFTLKPKVTGVNYVNTLGMGLINKNVKDLSADDLDLIKALMPYQLENERARMKSDKLKLVKYNEQEANELLSSFCNVQKRAKGSGSLACGIKEIENNIFKEGRQALKTGVKTPRLAQLGSYMSGLFGAVDIPIELAFAAPHILRGDKDAAKKAMIVGLFGAGRDKIQRANEELGPDSATSRIYKYEKALEDFAGVYTDVVNAQKTLEREDLEKIPQKIQDSALEGLQNGIVRLKEIKDIVDNSEPNIQDISKSKKELTDLQAKGTIDSDDFTYLGQAISDPIQYPTRLNVGLSGFTGEEGPDRTYTGEDISDPRDFVEAQGDEMYPYMKEQGYLSKAVEDAFTGYTGKDILDRYSDVKIEDLDKLPQAEKEYAEKGLRELADRIGPQAALKIAEEQGLDPSVLSGLFGAGYLERQGFAKGGMSRRDFLKLLGTAFGTIGAAKAGLLKFAGKKAATDIITTPAVAGKPEWFDAVINKVIKEGIDITEKFATKEREIIHVQQLGEQEGARVIRDLDTGEIRLEYESPTNMGEEPVTFTYKPVEQLEEGKTVPARFEANEAEPRVVNWDGDIEFDDEFVTENVDELMSDTSALKQYGTGKLDEKDLKIRQIKTQKVQKINSDSSETLEYLESSDRGVMSGRSVEDYLYEAKRVGDIKDTGEPLMNPNVFIKGKPKK